MAAIHESFAFVNQWLPSDLIGKLLAFPYDPDAPSSLLIQGLPIDQNPPPTPVKDNIFDSNDGEFRNVPVAESWLMGISRLLGVLASPPRSKGDRGGIVRDLTRNKDEVGVLPMHCDYPRQCFSKVNHVEIEIFILFGIRSDPYQQVSTVVMDSRKLLHLLDEKDVKLLQKHKIQLQMPIPGDDKMMDQGSAFHAIDPDDSSTITLFDLPRSAVTSPEGGEAAVEAYKRLQTIAFENGEKVMLGPGDMLIINNGRLVHGRTAFHPDDCKRDGNGRWLIKSYVTNNLWKTTGTDGSYGLVDYPRVNAMDWIE